MSVVINGSEGVTTNSGAVYNGISAKTAQASTSGTSIDFIDIPSWVKRITVMFKGVSLSGTDDLLIQIGSGSITASGYVGTSNGVDNAGASSAVSSTTGFPVRTNNAGNTVSGLLVIALASSSFDYVSSHTVKDSTTNSAFGGGNVTLSGIADQLRIKTTGTNTFDAGSINILYE